jgi:hypothetical protein
VQTFIQEENLSFPDQAGDNYIDTETKTDNCTVIYVIHGFYSRCDLRKKKIFVKRD